MPKIRKNAVVLSEEEVNGIIKVNKVFNLFFELDRLIKSMSYKEFQMLERSLKLTKEELESGE